MKYSKTTGTFADRLKDLIYDKKKQGTTLSTIAEETGIIKASLSKYQNNEAEAGINNIVKLAKYFSVSTDYLLGLTDVPNAIKDTDDENLRIACDYTGLNKETIEILNNSKGSTISEFIQSCILSAYKNFTKIWNKF